MLLSEVKLTKRSIENANIVMEWMLLFGMSWVKWSELNKAGFIDYSYKLDKLDRMQRARLCTYYNQNNECIRLKAIAPRYMKRIRRLQAKEGLI